MPQPRKTAAANTNGSPAIKALKDEIAAIEKAQAPTLAEIETLQAGLEEGKAIIARNEQAIAILEGTATLNAPVGRPAVKRSAGTRTTTSPEERNAQAVAFIAAHPEGVTGKEVGDHLGVSQATIAKTLKELLESGNIAHNGEERRNSRYLPAAA